MKKLVLICVIGMYSTMAIAQENKLYNPEADAAKDIAAAIKKAAKEKKYVLIQAGGNWCGWC
ncbi:MAG: thioredoxin family protein, partial [Ferruginibacter sp.]